MISFHYSGRIPSKGNFRRGGPDWRKRWAAIKTFQDDLAKCAIIAGAKRKNLDGPKEVRIRVIGQRLDLDGACKASLDALNAVCYRDDAQVARLIVERAEGEPGVDVQVRDVVA